MGAGEELSRGAELLAAAGVGAVVGVVVGAVLGTRSRDGAAGNAAHDQQKSNARARYEARWQGINEGREMMRGAGVIDERTQAYFLGQQVGRNDASAEANAQIRDLRRIITEQESELEVRRSAEERRARELQRPTPELDKLRAERERRQREDDAWARGLNVGMETERAKRPTRPTLPDGTWRR